MQTTHSVPFPQTSHNTWERPISLISPPHDRYDNFQRMLHLERQLHIERMHSGLQLSQEAKRLPLAHHHRSASHTQTAAATTTAQAVPHIAPISAVPQQQQQKQHQRYSSSFVTTKSASISNSVSHPLLAAQSCASTSLSPSSSSSITNIASKGLPSSSPPQLYRSEPLSLPLPLPSYFDTDNSASACQPPTQEGSHYLDRETRKNRKYSESSTSRNSANPDDARESQFHTQAHSQTQFGLKKTPTKLTKPPPSASKTPYLYREKTSSGFSKTLPATTSSEVSLTRQGRQQTRQDDVQPRSRSHSITDRIRSSFDLSSHRRRERSSTVASEISVPVSMTPSEHQIPVTDLSGPEPRIVQNPGMCKAYRETNRLTKPKAEPKSKKNKTSAPPVATNITSEENRGRARTQEHDKSKRLSFLGWKRDPSKHSAVHATPCTDSPTNMHLNHKKSGSVAVPHHDFFSSLGQPQFPHEVGLSSRGSPRPQSLSCQPTTDKLLASDRPKTNLRTASVVPAAPIVTIVTPIEDATSSKPAITPSRRGFRDAARAAFRRSISRPPPEYETAAIRKQKLGASSQAHHTVTSLPISPPLELFSPPHMPESTPNSPSTPKSLLSDLKSFKTIGAIAVLDKSSRTSSPSLSSPSGSPPSIDRTSTRTPLRSVMSHGHLNVPSSDSGMFAIPRKSSRRQRVRLAQLPVGLVKDIDSANESDSPGPYTPSDPMSYFPQHPKFGHDSPRIRSDLSDCDFGERNASSPNLRNQANMVAEQKTGTKSSGLGVYPPPLRYRQGIPSPGPTMRVTRIPSPYGILSPYNEDSLVESQTSSVETPSISATSSHIDNAAEPLALINRPSTVKDLRGSSEPLTKKLVQCCHCKFYHDMPSKVYQCMAVPDPVVKDTAHGVSGTISVGVRCSWCQHGMKTTCCAGYTATVHLNEKLH
ncbi:hypothetical protein Cpir12675_004170 [Ceratocystis pirilliformis]|uniref:Uncharacterized protein n=1 Tax=Ceratocystis pirilliformis TaxID=259994 RepID=A0ABR3YZC6_9PEZI